MIILSIPAEENETIIRQICSQNAYEVRKSEESSSLAEFLIDICFNSAMVALGCVQIMQQHKSLKKERVNITLPNGTKIENAPWEDIKDEITRLINDMIK